MTTPITGVYEVAIPVRNLEHAEAFYRDVLGLEVGLRDEARRWLFLRAGAGMIVLQESPDVRRQHFAFTIAEADVARATAMLHDHGVTVDGPHVHDWIPAVSLYFADPDGHDVELCAPLAARERTRRTRDSTPRALRAAERSEPGSGAPGFARRSEGTEVPSLY